MKTIEIIIIDDDTDTNKITKISLSRYVPNCNIVTFTDPVVGLDYVKHITKRDEYIIFLDINMPTMDGWEFLELFEELPDNHKEMFKIYILSSSLDNRDIEKAKSNKNVVEYLIKPLSKIVIQSLPLRTME